MKFAKVKGAEDFYPKDKAVQNAVFASLRGTAARYCFDEVETPAMESVALLTAKSGDEVREQIFTLEKRGREELGLRFDLTVPMTRMFVEKQRELPKPTKWFALSRMWRYERPQKGRLREFYQLSAELFGSDLPAATTECVNLLIACLEDLGVTGKDVVVRLNNRKLLEGIVGAIAGKDVFEGVTRVIDKKRRISDAEFVAQLVELGLSKAAAAKVQRVSDIRGELDSVKEQLFAILSRDDLGEAGQEGLDDLAETLNALPEDSIEIDFSIARGLAYYTGTVFECFDRAGKFRAIAGGGQYDKLTQLLGGENCPAVGFGLGYSTLLLLLEELGRLPALPAGPEYFIATTQDSVVGYALGLAVAMRRSFSVEIDVMGRPFAKQLTIANKLRCRNLIVIGPDEIQSGRVKVKNMATGEETVMPISALMSQ